MNLKEFVKDYLSLTRKERLGIITIAIILLLIFFLPGAISRFKNKSAISDTSWIASIKKLEHTDSSSDNQYERKYSDDNNNSTAYQYDRSTNNYNNKPKGELFNFDPNTLSAEGWQKLGLRDKTIHTIQNYLAKGGHFKNAEGLQKIYGLFPNEFERIAPYIKIESGEPTGNKTFNDYTPKENHPVKTYTSRYSVVDINSTDTTALIALPGIGSKLAFRIVNFRDKLGGFYSVNQVGETFGLPDSTFQKIKQYLNLENTAVKKLNINTATIDELKAHPYIRYTLANPIIAYRNEHGLFGKIEDLKKIMAVTDEVYNKISPYLIAQ